ncbi:ATP-binding protein [Amycolatopsis circi]|uniref:ATP-binding protein n=1 Tax=Amycolatopsis circi TaxID=871959 RepID=UPI000E25E7AA|nr:ATP-binding protein [Amycolatopsis circi]
MSVDEVQHSRLPARAARLRLALDQDFAILRRIRERAAAFVRRYLPYAGADALDDVRLVLDEMACNAMRHARPPCELTLSLRGDRILLEVSDSLPDLARCREGYAGGGRGLALIDAIADRWGQTPLPGGKTVWAELSLCPEPLSRT